MRIISNSMDKLEEDIPGLLMSVGFEKAFLTVKWPFIKKKTFGLTFRKWIKSCYIDMSSAVINNDHLSEFFLLERFRQLEPLSPYLFILVLESLSQK